MKIKNKDPLLNTESVSIKDAIMHYLDEKETLELLSPASIYNRKLELTRFNKFCLKHNIIFAEDIHKNLIVQYLKSLKINRNSKATIKNILASFMDYMVEETWILENIAQTIKLPKVHAAPFDCLTKTEVQKLLYTEAHTGSKMTIDRNLLIYQLLLTLCLRVSEVSNLKLSDLQIEDDNKSLFIKRKGGKQKKMPVNDELKELFKTWLNVRSSYKKKDSPYIFLSTHGNQLDRKQIYWIVQNGLHKADIIKKKSGPHILRHTGASLLAQNHVNPSIIQDLLGHEHLNTTEKYLHFKEENLINAVNVLSDSIGTSSAGSAETSI